MPINKYFDNINLLRGFAAITVVIYHFIEVTQWKEFPNSGPLLWFRAGWMAVDLFFVISGFVIGLSIFFSPNSGDQSSANSFQKRFFLNRLTRIFPLYLLTSLVVLVFINPNLIFDHLLKNIFLHTLFLQNFFPEYRDVVNGVTWSLVPEIQFYIILLFFASLLLRSNIIILGVIFIVTAWLYRYGAFISNNNDALTISATIFSVADEFGIGFILARIYLSSLGAKIFSPALSKQVLFLCLVLALGYLCQLIYWHNDNYYKNVYMVIFYKTLLSISFGLVILFFCNLQIKGISKLVLYPFYYLGTISYGIYLWHMPIFFSINRVTGVPPVYQLLVLLATTILVASISWHFFEKPIISRYRNDQQKSV